MRRGLSFATACAVLVACSTSCSTSGGRTYPAGSCHSDADCGDAGEVCLSQATAQRTACASGCGSAPDAGLCQADSDCEASSASAICVTNACCGWMTCEPGCTADSACAPYAVCGADHRCTAPSCQSGADCLENFSCSGGACLRTSCSSDADCTGYCLEGACYPQLGACGMLP